MKKIFYTGMLLLLSGCTPNLEKALQVATKTEENAKVAQQEIHKTFPKITADFSAAYYPVRVRTEMVRDTIIVTFRDTVTLPGERLPCPEKVHTKARNYVSVMKCPVCDTEHTPIRELETKMQENAERSEARQKRIEGLEEKYGMSLAEINKQRNDYEVQKVELAEITLYFWLAAIAAILFFAGLMLKIFRIW